jgi:dTDP-4-dehydrorhamnose reductase
VTGVESMLGSNLAWALSSRCEVLGGFRQLAVESPAFRTTHWTPSDTTSIADLLAEWRPQWIVHCPSLAGSSWDAQHPMFEPHDEPAIAGKLAAAAAAQGCTLTVIASDAVFSGPRMFHDELSTPLGSTTVARNYLAVERALADTQALVIRTHAYGWNGDQGTNCFAENAYESLRRGQLPTLDGRRYATPILASDLADLLWHAQHTRLQGLLHLAGAERTSMYRFVREMAACLGAHCPEAKFGHAEPEWHEETSLSSRRARRVLARPTPMLREGLERFIAQADDQARPAWCVRPVRILADVAA